MRIIAILMLMTTAAHAEDIRMKPDNMMVLGVKRPIVTDEELAKLQPTEQEKVWALKRAYQINGNSMVHWGMIDLHEEGLPAKSVKTIRIIPVAKAEDKNEIDDQADSINRLQQKWVQLRGDKTFARNVCEEHGMHKVVRGSSWHCKK